MSFNWQEFLSLAVHVRGNAGSGYSEEASDRTAVSRAYYAAFCYARNYASNQQGFTSTGTARDHQLLPRCFQQHGKYMAARRLERLREWRNQCDYENAISNLNVIVTSALEYAQRVINECR